MSVKGHEPTREIWNAPGWCASGKFELRDMKKSWEDSDEREVVIDRGRGCASVSAGGGSREKQRDG
jgi:hypothetical protein